MMVGGVLYVSTSLSQVAVIDAATGKTRWVYDPETWKNGTPSNNGFVHRERQDERSQPAGSNLSWSCSL